MKKQITVYIICFLFIVLFIYASGSKLIDYSNFKYQLGRSPYTTSIAGFVAWFIPSIELLITILLFFNRTRLYGMFGAFFIMLLFTGYIYAMLHYSYYIPCSCGGILQNMSWHQHLIFNIFFSILSLIGILLLIPNKKHTNTGILTNSSASSNSANFYKTT